MFYDVQIYVPQHGHGMQFDSNWWMAIGVVAVAYVAMLLYRKK